MQVTRRKLAQTLAVAAATATLTAQEPPQAAPAPADAELQNARQYLRAGAQIVHNVGLPMATEPAFTFRSRV